MREPKAPFSHIEGWEDHALKLVCTWGRDRTLTGIIVNLPCPAQVSEAEYSISADFWHDVRQELRRRFGPRLFVLPQCSPAGDLSPHRIVRKQAFERSARLKGVHRRQEIALRIADAIEAEMSGLKESIEHAGCLRYRQEAVTLPVRRVSEEEAEESKVAMLRLKQELEEERRTVIEAAPSELPPRWYVPASRTFAMARWHEYVVRRFERSEEFATFEADVRVMRLGDVVFATNPFEYFVDFGLSIEVNSPAALTCLVQLAGIGTYVPTERAVAGGGYGARPGSSLVGPQGGRQLARRTLELIEEVWSGDA